MLQYHNPAPLTEDEIAADVKKAKKLRRMRFVSFGTSIGMSLMSLERVIKY